jgi:putative phosphoesterase
MKIGILSDTHNYFDPRIPELFAGVEHILHGGDVGEMTITLQLEKIAPVTAVTGNTDCGLPLREMEVIELRGRKFLVHHIVEPRELVDPVRSRIDLEKPDVVVFGHTHKPFCQIIDDVLFFNPGYAGKSRFGMERTVAILEWDEKGIRPKFLPLE